MRSVVTKKLAWLVYLVGLLFLMNWMWSGHQGLSSYKVHGWNWYHYWIGSKYHQELGYFDIYEQTVAGWKELGSNLGKVTSARDQHTYKMTKLKDNPRYTRSEVWSDARWAEFKADLKKLRPRQNSKKWSGCIKDRGYNASPAWNTPASWITNALDVGNKQHLRLAKAIDLIGILGIALLLPFAFGPTRAILAIGLALGVANNPTRFLGSFVQYDWIVLVFGSVTMIRWRRHGWGGFLLGAATMLRIFPAVFFAAMVARGVLDLLVTRRLPPWMLRLSAGFGLALVLGFGLGAMGPRGVDSWGEWRDKIAIHTHYHQTGDGRVGLKHIFGSREGLKTTKVPRISERFKNLESSKPVRLTLAALLLGLLAAAAWNRDELDCFVLAVAAFFILTVSSRYYWSALALLPFLGIRRGDKTSLFLGSGMALFMLSTYYLFCQPLGHTYIAWRTQNFFMLGAFTVGLSLLAWRGFADPSYDPSNPTAHDAE